MMPGNIPLRRFVGGNESSREITATNLNQPIEVLDQLRHEYAANKQPMKAGDGLVQQVRLGVIVATGPNDEHGNAQTDDLLFNRYWVKLSAPDGNLFQGDPLELVPQNIIGLNGTVRATNLAERHEQHGLKTDGSINVILYRVLYPGPTPTTHTYFEYAASPLRYGKVQSPLPDCNNFANVKECNEDGTTIYSQTIIGVAPTKGGCDNTSNSFCYHVGDVIAYIPNPEDPNFGLQVGAYKPLEVGHTCLDSGTNTVLIPDIKSVRDFNGDFFLKPGSDCGGSYTNTLSRYWRGNIVVGYAGTCGGMIGSASTGGIKVFDFDSNGLPGRPDYNTNHARIAFDIDCGTTTANVPTINGVGCTDYSLPKFVTILGHLPTATIEWVSNVTCNGDGTITKTYSSARVCVPF